MRRVLAGFLGVLLLAAQWSCRTVEYVPVESARTDTVRQYVERTDSVYARDTLLIRERGDTVVVYRTRTVYRERTRRDTAYVARTDTVVRTVTRTAEKPLPWWRRFLTWAGGAAVLLSAAALWRKLKTLR